MSDNKDEYEETQSEKIETSQVFKNVSTHIRNSTNNSDGSEKRKK